MRNEMERSCALTGHRTIGEDFSKDRLKETFLRLIGEGIDCFYCGMAVGFDLIACEILQEMKKYYPGIKIIACIPCPEQSAKFGSYYKSKYDRLLAFCDDSVIISPRYDGACMHKRNRYMVDRALFLVAYCKRSTGGTAGTVRYARKKERNIIFV